MFYAIWLSLWILANLCVSSRVLGRYYGCVQEWHPERCFVVLVANVWMALIPPKSLLGDRLLFLFFLYIFTFYLYILHQDAINICMQLVFHMTKVRPILPMWFCRQRSRCANLRVQTCTMRQLHCTHYFFAWRGHGCKYYVMLCRFVFHHILLVWSRALLSIYWYAKWRSMNRLLGATSERPVNGKLVIEQASPSRVSTPRHIKA